jgi:ABC-type bacteriocin/lantibiotic exporter with double-glycine peptidase domain
MIDPVQMSKWSYENGYWCKGSGSYHALIPDSAKAFGLNVEGCSASESERIIEALSSGKLVVAIMTKGHFTSNGHFIVLRGVTKEGKILVADPASNKRSKQEWDLSIILNEASKHAGAGGPFWIISEKAGG